MTPEWTRTDHGQMVFYTEQRCIPLQGQCHFNSYSKILVIQKLIGYLCDRSKSGSGGADGGGAPAAGVSARGPEPL